MGPLTGDAFIGKEQLGFARCEARRWLVRLVETDTRLDPARASKVAQLHARPDVLAVVGPADSREVLAVAPVFKRKERLPFVSGSALHHALTNGSIPSFFRVAPSDRTQAPTIAAFLEQKLRANRRRRGRPLALLAAARERRRDQAACAGRGRDAQSVSQRTTDFGSLVSRIDAGVDVVFLPWQVAATAQEFGEQLRAPASNPSSSARTRSTRRLQDPGLVRRVLRARHPRDRGEHRVHRGLRRAVRLELRPRDLRGGAGCDRGGQEGVRRRPRHARRGGAQPRGDVTAADGARPAAQVHGARRGDRGRVLHLQARSRRPEDDGRLRCPSGRRRHPRSYEAFAR